MLAPLPQLPSVGLACHAAAPCTHVGVAVWVSRPARRVTVSVGGRRVALATGSGRGPYRHSLFWQGFFRDAGVAAHATDFSRILLVVRVVPRVGSPYTARVRVPVSAGYG